MADILGVDVSTWQGAMDWSKAQQAGARFAYCRAGSINLSGGYYADYQLAANKKCSVPFGWYWYFRPQFNGESQAQYFWNLIKDVPGQLPPVCDVEDGGGVSQTTARVRVKAFLDEIARLSGKRPIVYTSAYRWNSIIGTAGWEPQYDLWTAHYTTRTTPLIPAAWQSKGHLLWQFSADGNGRGAEFGAESAAIDIDRFGPYFAGDETAFLKWTGQQPEPPPQPPPSSDLAQRVETLEKQVELQYTEMGLIVAALRQVSDTLANL